MDAQKTLFMTKPQLSALEWAIEELSQRDDTNPYLFELTSLLDAHKSAYLDLWDPRRSLVAFLRKHDVTIPFAQFDSWRMLQPTEQLVGEIQGLPESRGIVRATNGILCFIELSSGALFEGHYESFVPDPKENPHVRLGRLGQKVHQKVSSAHQKVSSAHQKFLAELDIEV